MSKRINVMLSDTLNDRLDNYSERYGVSKSSIVGFVLGQWIDQVERANSFVYGATGNDGFLADLFKNVMVEEKLQK
ncbi:hypothetical protein [Clostridium fungisolvens]|uniref:CopG family transcriptional regulator n=1 Tax=Clostridium fungisolvens TaxID=1604897 RepID=A0A6V8SPM3_9CLOT|nr:hypothetical protein [Clostridium fungisolvens]GFP78565.1 hypothetical protein bsdtw1_04804 [Clostridium fungisolvens]